MENSLTRYLELIESGAIEPIEVSNRIERNAILDNLLDIDLSNSFKSMKSFGLEHEILMESISYAKNHPLATNKLILTEAFKKFDLL